MTSGCAIRTTEEGRSLDDAIGPASPPQDQFSRSKRLRTIHMPKAGLRVIRSFQPVGSHDWRGQRTIDADRKAPLEAGLLSTRSYVCDYPRESNDNPRLKAFCRVAPSVLLSDRAIFLTGVFPAEDFSSRTSVLVHSRRCDFLAAIVSLPFKVNDPTRGW
jgi:hypothetical protein